MIPAIAFLAACLGAGYLSARWWVRRLRGPMPGLVRFSQEVEPDDLMALCGLDRAYGNPAVRAQEDERQELLNHLIDLHIHGDRTVWRELTRSR